MDKNNSKNNCLNSFIISSHFSGEIIISLTLLGFLSITSFGFPILSAILFPIYSPFASAALWTTFLKTFFRVSSPVSNDLFLHFLAIDKNSYTLTVFCCWFYRVLGHFHLLISNVNSTLPYISNNLPF